jgi:peroxiredoxin
MGSPVSPLDASAASKDARPHYVTLSQLADSNEMVRDVIASLEAVASDGRQLGWEEISGGQPVVLVFIKNGCPCSVECELFFRRVERLYRASARFAGVLDGDVDSARRYATEHQVPYPVLADAKRTIIGRLQAKNGCYASLLRPDGVIVGNWPGSSADALRDLGRRIADLTGVAERPLDVTSIPNVLTTGCPFGR